MRPHAGIALLASLLLAPFQPATAQSTAGQTPTPGQNLTIGLSAVPNSLDPHFYDFDPNINMLRHVFEFLIGQGPHMELRPELALSWTAIDPTTWEFTLRPGVTWHDGAPFTAEDVAAAFRRAPTVPNSPSSFSVYLRQIAATQILDPLTIRFRTHEPFPLMPNYMGAVMITPKSIGENVPTSDFNSGKAVFGTGPFRFREAALGTSYTLARNPAWWGGAVAWESVTFRAIPQNGARVVALLSGDVQLIENVPPSDIERMRREPAVRLWESTSNRIVFFTMDQTREQTPFITANDGTQIANPLRDRRVRAALSMAINRQAIVERLMEGAAMPAAQLVAEGVFGHVPGLPVTRYDPEGARRLLAEAGYRDGFRMTIHGTSDRYVNDSKLVEALAQMLSRVGLKVEVETMPGSVYFARAAKLEFSFFLGSWGAGSSGGVTTVRTLLASYDQPRGMGANNRGRYSNPKVDALVTEYLRTIDDTRREAMLRDATRIALVEDVALLPTHFQVNTWASRAGIAYTPRLDGFTLATQIRPAP